MATSRTPSGFYIAHHPWLNYIAPQVEGAEAIVKVGHTGRLGDRLLDSSYFTCWGEGWRYLATIELPSKELAEAVEGAVLGLFKHARLDGRELIRIGGPVKLSVIAETALEAAKRLGVEGAHIKRAPTYARTAPPPKAPGEGPSEEVEGLRKALEGLTIVAPPSPPPPATAPVPVPMAAPAPPALDENSTLEQLDVPALLPEAEAAPLEDRQYQIDAAAACSGELARAGRTILAMACRCGKTRVAHLVLEPYLAQGPVLFLVPWLALLRQTAAKLQAYGVAPESLVLVGSSPAMTTDPASVKQRLEANREAGRPSIVVSTYHSSEAATAGGEHQFALTIFDECHHVCGPRDFRPSNYVLLRVPEATTGPRLFMTATPVTSGADVHMGQHDLFGGTAYRYHLRQGIEAGYVNNFEIQLVAASSDLRKEAAAPAQPGSVRADAAAPLRRFYNRLARLFSGAPTGSQTPIETLKPLEYLASQVCLAFDHLRKTSPAPKLLVFCRTIRGAEELLQAVKAEFQLTAQEKSTGQKVAAPQNGAAAQEAGSSTPCLAAASSRTTPSELEAVLNTFRAPGAPGILFNCRLFQEGVEFPPLNGVFFATPRHSPRDIIQSMCRALTRAPGKPRSAIFIPVPPAPAAPPAAGVNPLLAGNSRFETLLPFAEAIYSEDARFYEHLLDPAKPYPFGWLGVHGTAAQLLHAARRAIRYGAKERAGRLVDRLLRNDQIPWKDAFSELKRTVEVCRRYPKGNDGFTFTQAAVVDSDGVKEGAKVVLNFGAWYAWAQKEYLRHVAGEPSALQPHQVRDLESLPEWATRGIQTPYPPVECLATLEQLLEANKGVMPPVNINNGGWIGLDATPLERLSGFLTTISQQDGRESRRPAGKTAVAGKLSANAQAGAAKPTGNRGFKVTPEKAQELDRIFDKWGLTWRKERFYPEEEITAAQAELAVLAASKGGALSAVITPEDAARHLARTGRPGYLRTSGNEYSGPKTVIQIAHEKFLALVKKDPNDQFVQTHWPGYPKKHLHMEHLDVWEGGLAPPRVTRARNGETQRKLITRAPGAKKTSGSSGSVVKQ